MICSQYPLDNNLVNSKQKSLSIFTYLLGVKNPNDLDVFYAPAALVVVTMLREHLLVMRHLHETVTRLNMDIAKQRTLLINRQY